MTKHIEDVTAQTIAALHASLDLCITDKQRKALTRAIAWLKDITNPLTEVESQKWNENRDAYCEGMEIELDGKIMDDERRNALKYMME